MKNKFGLDSKTDMLMSHLKKNISIRESHKNDLMKTLQRLEEEKVSPTGCTTEYDQAPKKKNLVIDRCEHTHRNYYAKGLCQQCYHS